MTTVHTPQNPDNARAIGIDALFDMAEQINGLASKTQTLVCIVDKYTQDGMFPGTTAKCFSDVLGARDFYHFSPDDRRVVGFAVSELECTAKTILEMTDDFLEDFNTFRHGLKGGVA